MRQVLLAYGKSIMDQHRSTLADILKSAARTVSQKLIDQRWHPSFAETSIAEVVHSAVLAGGGENGDTVRAVTSVAREYCTRNLSDADLDQTTFWQSNVDTVMSLSRPGKSKERSSTSSRPSKLARYSFSADRSGIRTVAIQESSLPPDTIIALVKFFVLEWSHDFDYKVYDDLPVNMLMR